MHGFAIEKMSTNTNKTPPDDTLIVETLTGLTARYIPPTAAQLAAGSGDAGQPFRCQLGKSLRVQESGVLVGAKDDARQSWTADYFAVEFLGETWGDVLAKFRKGERAMA